MKTKKSDREAQMDREWETEYSTETADYHESTEINPNNESHFMVGEPTFLRCRIETYWRSKLILNS